MEWLYRFVGKVVIALLGPKLAFRLFCR